MLDRRSPDYCIIWIDQSRDWSNWVLDGIEIVWRIPKWLDTPCSTERRFPGHASSFWNRFICYHGKTSTSHHKPDQYMYQNDYGLQWHPCNHETWPLSQVISVKYSPGCWPTYFTRDSTIETYLEIVSGHFQPYIVTVVTVLCSGKSRLKRPNQSTGIFLSHDSNQTRHDSNVLVCAGIDQTK